MAKFTLKKGEILSQKSKTFKALTYNNLACFYRYLDNFVTNPYHILPYSGYSDPKSPENTKKCTGLVTKLSRYGQF